VLRRGVVVGLPAAQGDAPADGVVSRRAVRPRSRQRVLARARERWPQITELHTHYRGGFAYIDATLADGDRLPLFRLRYAGSASRWGFAIYRASHDDYQQAALPDGWPSGTPEDALDTACGLYLGDPTAWQPDPRRIRDAH